MRERFKFYTGLEPTDDQVKVLKDIVDIMVKKIVASAGRQSGKTLTVAVGILIWLFDIDIGQKINVLLVSAQDNVLYHHIREIFKRHPELEEQLTEVSKLSPNIIPLRGFELRSGNMVFVRGATEKNIRGIPADIVIIDEACEVMNDRILTALGNVTGKIAKFILLSTPHVDTSLFVTWASDKKSGFKLHQWSSENLPWHDKSITSTKKKNMSHEKYAVEVLGRCPTKAERAFFPGKHIEKCVVPVEAIREGGANSRLEIGIDWGYDAPTVLIVTERIGTTVRKILFIKEWTGKPIEMVGPEILKIISQYKPYVVKADSKPPEYKAWFERNAKGKVKFIDSALGHKEQMLGQLQRMVREHRLIIPQGFIDVVVELKKYRRKMIKGDDLVDALALSIYEPSVPLGSDSYGRVYFPENSE